MSVDPRVARRGVALLCVAILTAGLVAGANAAAAVTENAPGGTAPIPRLVAAPVAVRALAPPPPARAEDTGISFGPIEPFNAAAPYLYTRAEITAGAVSVSVNDPSLDGSRLSEHQIATIVSIAVPTTYRAVGAIDPASASDPRIRPDRPVWAVTVHSPTRSESTLYGTTDTLVHVYSILYDGPTGEVITLAFGVDYQRLGLPSA